MKLQHAREQWTNKATKPTYKATMPCECGERSYDQNNEISYASIVCFKSSLV